MQPYLRCVDTMLKRIKLIQKSYKITNEQLAKETGISKWSISKQLNGFYKLNLDIILVLLRLCPDVSADWLLLGRGNITHADARDIIRKLDDIDNKISSSHI